MGGSHAAGKLEEAHWLCPLEDRRRKDSTREGMLENFSLGTYLLLMDYVSRLAREGKARVGPEVAGIFQRLGTNAEFWAGRLQAMFSGKRLFGSHFAADRSRLRDVAARKGRHHLDNVIA